MLTRILLFSLVICCLACRPEPPAPPRPNIILLMADDLGWGDTGFNGNDTILTPALDEMAANGLRFERFYAAAPVCSPTRGSCLTGRHPWRYGIFSANVGHLPAEEFNLAALLQAQGYATGHFGKWHLGTLSREQRDANRGGRPEHTADYAPPWERGFEVCFSTESKVPTWDPMLTPEKEAGGVGNQGLGQPFGTRYWNERGEVVQDNLQGDDSRVIMDRVIPFIREAEAEGKPFLAVIWFHTPHTPVVAGEAYRARYPGLSEAKQHYYGCITAMDEQIGRLRNELKALDIHAQTMTFFASDNGPENRRNRPRSLGSTGGLSERKRSLHEGGIRVPALLEYPALIREAQETSQPFSTSDYLPSVLDLLELPLPADRPLDGLSLIPVLRDSSWRRPAPIAFRYGKQQALIDGRYKLYSADEGQSYTLFDLQDDPGEQLDLAAAQAERVTRMQEQLKAWLQSTEQSLTGADYAE